MTYFDSQTNIFEQINPLDSSSLGNTYAVFENFHYDAEYTISITVYDRTVFLKECLQSAISQKTNIKYNIIVIDDKENANSKIYQFMKDFRNSDNISYFRKSSNEGLMENMNRAIQLSRTELVVMIHDDDWLQDDYIDAINKYVKLHPSYHIYVPSNKIFYIDHFINIKSTFSEAFSILKGKWPLTLNDFLLDTCATPTGALYRKSAFIKAGGYRKELGMAADYQFFVNFIHQGYKILRINKKLFNYRFAENESMKQDTKDEFCIARHYIARFLIENTCSWPLYFKKCFIDTNFFAMKEQEAGEWSHLIDDKEFYSRKYYNKYIYKGILLYLKLQKFLRRT